MKKIRVILSVLLIAAILAAMSGCFMIHGQRMRNLKGTYELTHYTYKGKQYQYEDYLVITGGAMGYYVRKEADKPAYIKEVKLSYEYDTDDSSKIEYVVFQDALTTEIESGRNRVGVNGKILNYSRPETELFGVVLGAISVSWQKVDNATDLSYVEKQLGKLKQYDYEGFAARGIYELNVPTEIETGNAVDSKYQYLYYVVDTAMGVTNAKIYYALKETPTQHIEKTVPFSGSEDWKTLTIDGTVWTIDPMWGIYYYYESEGLKHQITCVDHNISDERLQELIDLRTPVVEE